MVKLHFSNNAPSSKKTTLLSVSHDSHVFTRNETMQAHADFFGGVDNWKYPFSLVIVTDRTKEELEYLLDQVFLEPSNTIINKYTFIEPMLDSEHYSILKNTGQIYLTFTEFQPYMRLT